MKQISLWNGAGVHESERYIWISDESSDSFQRKTSHKIKNLSEKIIEQVNHFQYLEYSIFLFENKDLEIILNKFNQMGGTRRRDKIRNRNKWYVFNLNSRIVNIIIHWKHHAERMKPYEIPWQIMNYTSKRRFFGHPKLQWRDQPI